jgi:hypothetical protein
MELMDELTLRADLAKRVEDLRIATKHRVEAAARVMTPANKRAYERALAWEQDRREAEQAARGRVIRHALAERSSGYTHPLDRRDPNWLSAAEESRQEINEHLERRSR